MRQHIVDLTELRSDRTPLGRQLRRTWTRAAIACAILLAVALTLPRIQRALDPQRERRAIARSVERTSASRRPCTSCRMASGVERSR